MLSVRGVGGAELAPINLDVRRGEVVGIAGLTGSGRDELASLLSGRRLRTGEVAVDGATIPPVRPAGGDRRRPVRGAGRPRPRRAVPCRHAPREPDHRRPAPVLVRWPACARGAEKQDAKVWIEELDVRPARSEAIIGELSGGNQQKVVMARWFRCTPRVLVLDEPTQGVDVGSKADIHRLIDLASAQGTATVVCSSDSAELERLCSRVIVLQRGVVIAELHGAEITSERIEETQLIPLGTADAVVAVAAPTNGRGASS